MIMKKLYILISGLMLALPCLRAQTLDPTVEVSRSYEGKLMEVHKPALTMAVPDSVLRFDLNFDYSVFDSPYKGSYEFNPYAISMKPAVAHRRPETFYLRAGAGYTFHPEFDMVWSPVLGKTFGVDIYAMNRSYVGKYLRMNPSSGSTTWKGRDVSSQAGASFHWDWRKSRLDVGAGYHGLQRRSLSGSDNNLNAVDFNVRAKSKTDWPADFLYDFSLNYSVAKDVMTAAGTSRNSLAEHNADIFFRFGPVSRTSHVLYFDAAMMLASYSGYISTAISEFSVVPHYVFRYQRLKVDAGIRLAKLMRSDGHVSMYKTREQVIYPDIRIDVEAIKDMMMLYLRIGGGNKVNTYSSLLADNHYLTMDSGCGQYPLLDTTVEKMSVIFGAEGSLSSAFRYHFRAGHVNYKNSLLNAVWVDAPEGVDPRYLVGVGYAPYKKWFVSMDWTYRSEVIRCEGELAYNAVWGEDFTRDAATGLLRPAALKGDVSVGYDWKKRVRAGVGCAFSTAMKGYVPVVQDKTRVDAFSVPGYADLYVDAEYVAGSRLVFWAKLGNLLDMPVMYVPMYAEKGVRFTAGIALNF